MTRFALPAFAVLFFSALANAASLDWESSYGSAHREASENRAELFIYFEPVKATAQSIEFSEKTLEHEEVQNALETRVLFKISSEEKLGPDQKTALSEDPFFKSAHLKKLGGWVLIDFNKSVGGTLKALYEFHAPTPQGVFSSWSSSNVIAILTGKQTPTVSTVAAASTVAGSANGGSPGGLEGEILDLINQHRIANGRQPLSYDPALRFYDDRSHSEYYRRGFGVNNGAGAWGGDMVMSAHQVVNMWKGSGAHNAQMLKPNVRRHAVYAVGTNYNWAALP